jgi:acetylornithine deacetylase/succinyl-diaminopimelate desuccinylase-like protein
MIVMNVERSQNSSTTQGPFTRCTHLLFAMQLSRTISMMKQASRQGAIARALEFCDGGHLERCLAERVAFRTESQKGAVALDELQRYLNEAMRPAFEAMGFVCTIYDNPFADAGPVLLASRHEGDDLTTVLGYGHGDVILGQDEQWTKGKGPWVTSREGDRIYGRGTADNKAQHTINMAVLNAIIEERGALGFNAKFIVEMGEENGSRGLREIIEANREAFRADVLIGSDGPRASPDKPTLTLGSRGGVTFQLTCELREGAHHSGNWGGLIADPAIKLAHALSTITSSTGAIQIKDWLPPARSDAVKEVLDGLEIEAGPEAPAIDLDWGEPGMTPAEKVCSWNSFAVLAMISGNPQAPVNAIAPSARAVCQLRYVAGTDVSKVLPALRAHLDAGGFEMIEINQNEQRFGGFSASATPPDHTWAIWARNSMARSSNAPPAVIPSMGGSICNDLFTDLLGIPALWIPHSYAGCSQHAPDEHVLVPLCRSALRTMAGLYWDLGEGDLPH